MKIIAFLPAKGTSNRVASKNMKLLDDKPLFLHTLEKLCGMDIFDEVYLDTESDELISLAEHVKGFKVMKRDPELASNKTDGNQMLLNEIKFDESGDIYVQILCTSPFIEEETIVKAVEAVKSGDYDSATLVKREKLYTWNKEGVTNYDINNIPNSNTLDDTIIETMGLYVIAKEAALKTQRRIGESVKMVDANALEAVDVNYPEDFHLASFIAAGMREDKRKLLNNIKQHISSCMLSDILDDLGYPNQIIKGLMPNIGDAKLFGPAKTLRLRELEEGEDFRGIYDALNSYETIIPNDIIIVENEVSDYAYFGELNANLAIRSGASGVIVGGMTRDSAEVLKTGLPVFAKGYTCQDVRKRATTDSMNKKISIQGIDIHPEDLIFADKEGVIIIPKQVETKAIEKVFESAKNEKKILSDIAEGKDVEYLTKNYGFF